MKRELMSVLLGAALILPADAEAQRGRERRGDDDDRRVERLAPVKRSGRIAPPAARVRARPYTTRARVVYSSHAGYRPARAYRARAFRPWRDARIRLRLDWGRARLWAHARPRLDRHLSPGELRRVLGSPTVNRIRRMGRRSGLRGAPRGHWVDTRRHGLVLVVTMERVDVAEFLDYDRDGFIDDAFFFRDHRGRRIAWP